MKNRISAAMFTFFITFIACKKENKTPDTPVVTVPERLEVLPTTKSILVGDTAQFTVKYFDNRGKEAAPPASITWRSENSSIATVDGKGLVTGKAAGQVKIEAAYKEAKASATLTVASNNNQLATITIQPSNTEVLLNGTAQLTATAKNNNGDVIQGINFTWILANIDLADVNASGLVTGKKYGTTGIKAVANGIESAPAKIEIVRKSVFSGRSSAGDAKLKVDEAGKLRLETVNLNYSGGAPDLRIYLTNNPNSVADAKEIFTLNGAKGTLVVPIEGASITQYRYAIIWCKQFGGNYGTADFN